METFTQANNTSGFKISEEVYIEKSKGVLKFSLFIFLLLSILIIQFIADAVLFSQQLLETNSVLAYGYIALISSVIYMVAIYLYKEISRFLEISRVEKVQEEAERLKITPNKDVVQFAYTLINKYDKNKNIYGIQEGIKNFQDSCTQLPYGEILPSVSKNILSPIDKKAEAIILKYAKENGIATAISPVPLFDAIFIIWRNIRMVNEISTLYGFRAGLFGNFILLRRLTEQLLFIGVTEIVEDSVKILTGQTIASKLSSSVAGGLGNAIFTIRVGLAAVKISRPIREESNTSLIVSFLKNFNPFKQQNADEKKGDVFGFSFTR